MKRKISVNDFAAACYFRTSTTPPFRKALIQITEWCNLSCAHCFVSAGQYGEAMSTESIARLLINRLKKCNVISVTLTGGEPFAHPDIIAIVKLFRADDIAVSICTNATLITEKQIDELIDIGGVEINVSLDGFRAESHGKFRGNRNSFYKTRETITLLGNAGLLKGLLATPNRLVELNEYSELCQFANESGAAYVLMNPLSNFGRGVRSKRKLAEPQSTMNDIRTSTINFVDKLDITYIRFPNNNLPLNGCEAGNIIYVFVNGDVAICPYLVFAARTPESLYDSSEFIVGNIITDDNIIDLLEQYDFKTRFNIGGNATCTSCSIQSTCGKGCPAAVIANGKRIEEVDTDMCPFTTS